MKRQVFLTASAAMIVLSACSNPVEDAKRRLEIVRKNGGSLDDICRESKNVAEAYLQAGDAEEYGHAERRASISCLSARLGVDSRPASEGGPGNIEADNLEAAAPANE